MTKTSIAIALTVALGLAACAKSESTAEGGEAAAEHKHIAASDGDAARGEKLAAPCFACHGDKGAAPQAALGAAVLAGQYQDYLFHTLQQYRDGGRTNQTMVGQAKALDDQAMADLAAYFASQKGTLGDLSNH